MKKFLPTSVQLKSGLEHIHYEMNQLTQLIDLPLESYSTIIKNALVESTLIHVRVLLDFFQKTKRIEFRGEEMDDILSMDYGFEPTTIPISKGRLNKNLVHLTYSRVASLQAEQQWFHDECIMPILLYSKQFANHLILNYLPVNFSEQLEKWQILFNKLNSTNAATPEVRSTLTQTTPDTLGPTGRFRTYP